MKSPRYLDTCDIDCRPSLRRSTGGVTRFCERGDMGSPESNSSSATNNSQVTGQGGAAGSTTTLVGASGASGVDAANVSNSAGATTVSGHNNNLSVTYTSLDTGVATAAIQNSASVAGYAVQAEGQTSANALQFGAEALAGSNQTAQFAIGAEGQTATNALASNNLALNSAFGFGSEALDAVATTAQQAQIEANQTSESLAATIDHIAQSAIGAGFESSGGGSTYISTPAGSETPSESGKWNNLIWIGVGLATLWVFANKKGKTI